MNGGLAEEGEAEETADERILKRKKMTVEGMDCHMRNPKKRLWSTVSGGVAEAGGGID